MEATRRVGHYILKALLTLCFWFSKLPLSELQSETNAEVMPSGVWYMHIPSVQGVLCPHAHFRV